MRYQVIQDKLIPDGWRVEFIDHEHDGECYVAVFTGPSSRDRAREYAEWKEAISAANKQSQRQCDRHTSEVPSG